MGSLAGCGPPCNVVVRVGRFTDFFFFLGCANGSEGLFVVWHLDVPNGAVRGDPLNGN